MSWQFSSSSTTDILGGGTLVSHHHISLTTVHILLTNPLTVSFLVYSCLYTVSGEANFAMTSTRLTVGGFTQPGVARALIEMPANAEKGLSHRFLWLFPNPLYKKLSNLGVIDQDFLRTISKKLTNTSLPAAYCTRSSVNILLICTLLALTFMTSINCLIHLSRFTILLT